MGDCSTKQTLLLLNCKELRAKAGEQSLVVGRRVNVLQDGRVVHGYLTDSAGVSSNDRAGSQIRWRGQQLVKHRPPKHDWMTPSTAENRHGDCFLETQERSQKSADSAGAHVGLIYWPNQQ